MLRSNTHDQGCGLVMIGGPDSFGAGGWQNTPVEKALPVDCDIKSLKVQGKGGLVLIMHASRNGRRQHAGRRRSPSWPSSGWGRPTWSASSTSTCNAQVAHPFQDVGGNQAGCWRRSTR